MGALQFTVLVLKALKPGLDISLGPLIWPLTIIPHAHVHSSWAYTLIGATSLIAHLAQKQR